MKSSEFKKIVIIQYYCPEIMGWNKRLKAQNTNLYL